MVKIEAIKNYTIPYCGNNRLLPYGELIVSDGKNLKTCKIHDEGAKQYIVCNNKRYYIRNAGSLYYPKFVIFGSIEDAAERLKEAGYKYAIQSDATLTIIFKDNSRGYTQIILRDDTLDGYYMIDGRVENLIDWIKADLKTHKTQRLAVTWEMCGFVEVEGKTIEEAMANFEKNPDMYPLPRESEFVESSFALSTNDVEMMAAMCQSKGVNSR